MNQNSLSSYHDQIMRLFADEFNVPEITILILSHCSIPYLRKTLGATPDQLFIYVKNTGYEKFKSQLMEIGGYDLLDDGSFSIIYKFNVISI